MRFIDHKNCPSNVRAFTAKSFSEAVVKADALMREKGVQAAVWLRDDFNKVAPKYEDLSYIHKLLSNDKDMPRRFTINIAAIINAAVIYAQDIPLLKGFIDSDLLEDMSKIFTRAQAKIRAVQYSNSDAHADGVQGAYTADETCLFYGLPIKILEYFGFTGTAIYDTNEIDPLRYQDLMEFDFSDDILERTRLPQPWYVRGTDMLFLTNKSWPEEKVCVHGEPEYDSDISRVISIFDVRHYKRKIA